jgi:hypothetical protein
MARYISLLLATLVLTILPGRTQAGDVITGFQIDNTSQYFGYLGVRTPLLLMSGGTTIFAQAISEQALGSPTASSMVHLAKSSASSSMAWARQASSVARNSRG